MIWNETSVSTLRKMWANGKFTSEIAETLGTTRNAIIGKAHRMELPKRSNGHFARRKRSKLKPAHIREIRKRFTAGERQSEIAKEFGLTSKCIWSIVNERTWRDVT